MSYSDKYKNYTDKYLKYKSKYEKLQNNQQDVIILLMFLGGLPSDDNIEIYNHWKNIIECSKSKINYKIIVHPIDITNYNIPTIWNEFDVMCQLSQFFFCKISFDDFYIYIIYNIKII